MEIFKKFAYKLYDEHPKIINFWQKHPCWFGIITGAISGVTTSLIANIILLLARKLLM